jgi:nitroimidazol reductase NimA-like FMN-containing flavoprotein (pyridoxamine 5'-phosphate oxidase superfamily)
MAHCIVSARIASENAGVGRPAMSAPPPRNRRQQIQLTPEEQAAFLRQHHKAAFATIDKDGFPHVVGMNYVVKDGAFYMTSYGKAQKVLNVRRNHKVGLMVETGDSYAEQRGVMVRGHCEIIEDPEAVKATFAFRAEGRDTRAPTPGALASAPKRVVLNVLPRRVTSWDHRKLGGGY